MSRPSNNDDEFSQASHTKKPVKRITNSQTNTPNFFALDATDSVTMGKQGKTIGFTSGSFIKSQSKKDPRITKYWLEKGTMSEALMEKWYDALNYTMANWDEIYLHNAESQKLEYLESCLEDENISSDQYQQLEAEIIYLENLSDLRRVENVSAMAKSVLTELGEHYPINNNAVQRINDMILGLTTETYTAKTICPMISQALEEITTPLIAKEKAVEFLGGEINRLITKGRKSTPKVRILHDQSQDRFRVLSRISQDITGQKSGDLFDVFGAWSSETTIDNNGQKVAAPFKTLDSKPLKGLYESIITRIFLGDAPRDIKLDNMIVVDCGEYFQVENIDFGNSFQRAHPLGNSLLNPEALIATIDEIGSSRKNNDGNTTYNFYVQNLLQHTDQREIIDTIKTISELKDSDLLLLAESLREIKNNNEKDLIPDAEKQHYLYALVERRNTLANLYKSHLKYIEKTARENQEIDAVTAQLSDTTLGNEMNVDSGTLQERGVDKENGDPNPNPQSASVTHKHKNREDEGRMSD